MLHSSAINNIQINWELINSASIPQDYMLLPLYLKSHPSVNKLEDQSFKLDWYFCYDANGPVTIYVLPWTSFVQRSKK